MGTKQLSTWQPTRYGHVFNINENILQMNIHDKIRIFSPLLFFVVHVVYLGFWSSEPFLKKWLDGSFSLFVTLVLCNIIRTRIESRNPGPGEDGPGGAAGGDEEGSP